MPGPRNVTQKYRIFNVIVFHLVPASLKMSPQDTRSESTMNDPLDTSSELDPIGDSVERGTYTVPQAGKRLGIGRNAAYEAARTGQIPTIRIGRRIVVPIVALERMLKGLA